MLSYDGPFCQHGASFLRFPVSWESYNIPGLRTAIDILRALPAHLNGSALVTEAYPTHGVQSVSDASTAYPDRENNLLLSPFMTYAADRSLDEEANLYGRRMQEALANATGKPLNAYVNYANGYESQEALFGYEPWRLEKLRKLKREYDPDGKFGYYAPIMVD